MEDTIEIQALYRKKGRHVSSTAQVKESAFSTVNAGLKVGKSE